MGLPNEYNSIMRYKYSYLADLLPVLVLLVRHLGQIVKRNGLALFVRWRLSKSPVKEERITKEYARAESVSKKSERIREMKGKTNYLAPKSSPTHEAIHVATCQLIKDNWHWRHRGIQCTLSSLT